MYELTHIKKREFIFKYYIYGIEYIYDELIDGIRKANMQHEKCSPNLINTNNFTAIMDNPFFYW